MRYWTFDVCSLIADYEKNRRTLSTIKDAIKLSKEYLENPVGATTRGDWEQYLSILELREAEYELYCGMVANGLMDLPEVERLVLRWWLIDKYDDDYIIEHCGIKNTSELRKIKKIAITKFTNIVMPN